MDKEVSPISVRLFGTHSIDSLWLIAVTDSVQRASEIRYEHNDRFPQRQAHVVLATVCHWLFVIALSIIRCCVVLTKSRGLVLTQTWEVKFGVTRRSNNESNTRYVTKFCYCRFFLNFPSPKTMAFNYRPWNAPMFLLHYKCTILLLVCYGIYSTQHVCWRCSSRASEIVDCDGTRFISREGGMARTNRQERYHHRISRGIQSR